MMECQFGFRKNRSTTDAIFSVRKVIEKTDGFYVCCFVDLRAAYDHINREMLFDILGIRTGSRVLVNLLREFYTNTSASIRGAKETFITYVGCRQGAQESPMLFNIYLDFVLRICEQEILSKFPHTGIKYRYNYPPEVTTRSMRAESPAHGVDYIRLIAYADDLVVFCRSITEMEAVMAIYYNVFKRFGLTIAQDKTKTMLFNATEELAASKSVISINGSLVENVRKFRYLGHVISNTIASEFLTYQIGAAYDKWNEMKDILMDKEIKMCVRLQFLEACVQSRLLYSVQSCDLKAVERNKIEVIWMNFLRRMVRNGFARRHIKSKDSDDIEVEDWAFKYTNDDIRKITGAKLILGYCEKQHLKYVAHIVRQHNSFYPKRLLFAIPEKKFVRNEWTRLEQQTGLDPVNLRRIMMNKDEFMRWLKQKQC